MLMLADDELRSYLLPMILKSQEAYYDYDDLRTINSTGIYDMSTRAVASKLVNAALIDSDNRQNLSWITEERLIKTDNTSIGVPGIYFKRNQVYLIPPTEHGFPQIKFTISLRPGKFVLTTAAAQITAIAGNTLTFATSTIPSTFTSSVTYDLIQANPHFDPLGIDLAASSVTSTTVVLTATPSSRLAVGDWLCLAGESPIVQVPVELQPLLAQKVANTMNRAQGDLENLAAGEKELGRMEKAVTSLYTPRIQKEGKKLVLNSNILRRF
jgi:hypothetical protein